MKKFLFIFAICILIGLFGIAFAAKAPFSLDNITSITVSPSKLNPGETVKISVTVNRTDIDYIVASFVPSVYTATPDPTVKLTASGTNTFSGNFEVPDYYKGATWNLGLLTVYVKDDKSYSFGYQTLQLFNKARSFTTTNIIDYEVSLTAPAITSPTSSTVDKTDIVVKWSEVNSADSYKMIVQDLTTDTEIINRTVLDNESVIFSSELNYGHKYKISIASKNGSLISTYSSTTFSVRSTESVGNEGITSFFDLPSNHWAKEAIDEMVARGHIKGYKDGSFKPEKNITRAEFIKILINAFKKETFSSTATSFTDVLTTHWAAREISIAKEERITDGYADGTFKPNAFITRAEIVSMICAIKKLTPKTAIITFKDISKHWAKDAIISAASNGIVSGYEDKTFRPDAYATRAEACVMIETALK